MWCEVLLCASATLLCYYVYFKAVASKYWKKRNVFHVEPVFILGNVWKSFISSNICFILQEKYEKWKDKKLVGFWSFTTPSLLVTDLELIRRILIRDFSHFVDRNAKANEDIDPLAGHLVNLSGSKWRNLRVKLTPTFTSGKMKMMFPAMVDCGLQLQKFLARPAQQEQQLEMREIFGRFTTDIISSCVFGIETDTINNPDSEFRTYGKKIFEPGYSILLRFILTSFFPFVRDLFRIRSFPKDISDFFINLVRETMDYRTAKGLKRNDFLDLLIQLRNKGRLDDVDSDQPTLPQDQPFTLNQAAAQAAVFFAAGFETSSSTLSFAFYELALNPDIQQRLQKEIDESLAKSGGNITYDGILEMEYLDWVIQETLRKYPPLNFLARTCTKEYHIPEMQVTLEKGIQVLISTVGIQRDPQFFPDPDKFDPMRFSPEEKSKRNRLTSMPFGEGPRNCIGKHVGVLKKVCVTVTGSSVTPGKRFGLLQTKVGVVSVLSEYNVEVSERTPIPLLFKKRTFVLIPTGGINLKIKMRKYTAF